MRADEWDARYREAAAKNSGALWHSEPSPDLVAIVSALDPARALDLATGDGRNALWLAERGWVVTGVDSSAAGLAIAADRAAASELEIEWVVGDALDWIPAELFDLVTITYLQLPEPDLAAVIGRVAGWLVPGGRMLVIGHDRSNLGTGAPGPRDPAVLHTAEQLERAARAAGLTVLESRTVERHAAELAHPGEPDASGPAIDTLLLAVSDIDSEADAEPDPGAGSEPGSGDH